MNNIPQGLIAGFVATVVMSAMLIKDVKCSSGENDEISPGKRCFFNAMVAGRARKTSDRWKAGCNEFGCRSRTELAVTAQEPMLLQAEGELHAPCPGPAEPPVLQAPNTASSGRS